MTVPRLAGVLNAYNDSAEEVRSYFQHFPKLAKDFPWDVSISYMFGGVELAHNMTIYCGIVKLHKVDSSLARTAVDAHHMTRAEVRELFRKVFRKDLSNAVTSKIEKAEKIRDKIMHGKTVSEEDKRKTVVDVLNYACNFNDVVYDVAGFRPFGSLRGFKGRATSLDKPTSRWILKGMGFAV